MAAGEKRGKGRDKQWCWNSLMKIKILKPSTKLGTRRLSLSENGIPPTSVMNPRKDIKQKSTTPHFQTATSV